MSDSITVAESNEDEVVTIEVVEPTVELDERHLKNKALLHHCRHALYMLLTAALISAPFILLGLIAGGVVRIPYLSEYDAALIPPLILFICTLWYLIKYIYFRIVWNNAVHLAGNLGKTKKMIDGFTQVFRLYAHTRRSAMQACFWIIFGIYSTLFYSFGWIGAPLRTTSTAVLISAALTICLMLVAYYMFRSFLPGDTFIEHVISLNERAATAQQSNSENMHQTRKLIKPYKQTHYWWFY